MEVKLLNLCLEKGLPVNNFSLFLSPFFSLYKKFISGFHIVNWSHVS